MTTLDTITTGSHLIDRLYDHNPWWQGTKAFGRDGACPTHRHADIRSDFYPFVRGLDYNRFRVVSGPAMVGKTTLLYHLIAACTDTEFRNRHIPQDVGNDAADDDSETEDEGDSLRENLESIVGDLDRASPRQFLYVPLFDDPVYQVRAGDQLQAAIDHFERTVRPPERSEFVLLLDDVQALHRTGDETWTDVVKHVVEDGWRVVLTTTASRKTWNALRQTVETLVNGGSLFGDVRFDNWVKSTVPWKFRDFGECRRPELRSRGAGDRFSSSDVRSEFKKAVITGDPEAFQTELVDNAKQLPPVDWSTEILAYSFLGGTLGIRFAGDPEFPLGGEGDVFSYLWEQEDRFQRQRADVLERYRDKLHRQTSNADINLSNLEDPERLLALVAHLISGEEMTAPTPVDGLSFADLTDTFEVDRRTLRDKYFSLLDMFYLLTASEEYDNQRPKEVRLYPRDFGMIHAFTERSFDEFRGTPRARRDISMVAAFDHTVRLTYSLNDERDPKRGRVKFWSHEGVTIDFVPRFGGRPVPIVFGDVPEADALDLTAPPVTTFDAFFAADHDSEQDPIEDHHASALADDNLVDRRLEYVDSDAFAGEPGTESRSGAPVATDGEAPFGLLLTQGTNEPIDQQVNVRHDFARKPVVELPLWLYLFSA